MSLRTTPSGHHPVYDRGCDAAGVAALLSALGETGIRLRASGWCMGDLRPGDVSVRSGRLCRRRVFAGRLRYRWRAYRHVRSGHDVGCHVLGVPLRSLSRLAFGWADPRIAAFATEMAGQLVAELVAEGVGPRRGWTPERARAALRYAIRSRVTPDHRVLCAATVRAARRSAETPSGVER